MGFLHLASGRREWWVPVVEWDLSSPFGAMYITGSSPALGYESPNWGRFESGVGTISARRAENQEIVYGMLGRA